MYDWSKTVNMHFNSDKFECLRFWPGCGTPPAYQYKGPENNEIEVKAHLKDLGVQVSSDLSFKLQVEKTVAAASKLAGWGLRSFRRRSKAVMKPLWQTLIQPKMDYCILRLKIFLNRTFQVEDSQTSCLTVLRMEKTLLVH